MTIYNYDKFRSGGNWKNPIVLEFPDKQGYDNYVVNLQVNTGSSVFVGAICETIQDNGAELDLYDLTVSGDESRRALYVVLDHEENKERLAEDNSKDSCNDKNTPRGTTYFSEDTWVRALQLVPGTVLNTPVSTATTSFIGVNVASAGSGKIKAFDETAPDDPSANLGKFLSVATTTADLQWLSWRVGN